MTIALDDIVLVVAAGLAEPRHIADCNFGDVLDVDRNAVALRQHDIVDVGDFVTLRQIVSAAGVHQTDAADIHRLLAEVDSAAADVDVALPSAVITCGNVTL